MKAAEPVYAELRDAGFEVSGDIRIALLDGGRYEAAVPILLPYKNKGDFHERLAGIWPKTRPALNNFADLTSYPLIHRILTRASIGLRTHFTQP